MICIQCERYFTGVYGDSYCPECWQFVLKGPNRPEVAGSRGAGEAPSPPEASK